MMLHVAGCSHHNAPVAVRERLAFSTAALPDALRSFHARFERTDIVIVSTCNRVELYFGSEDPQLALPSHHDVVAFLADFHEIPHEEIFAVTFEHTGCDAARHLFHVASALDSMVVGEPQILRQVNEAFAVAERTGTVGSWMRRVFDAARRAAKRVQTETDIHRRRVSIPSVAVGEFASRLFERFEDKTVLVMGAGDMAEETVRYLADAGVRRILVVNRRLERAEALADRLGGTPCPWSDRWSALAESDLVITATGSAEPVITAEAYASIDRRRAQRPLFIVDLAVPRNVEPGVGDYHNVYLYCLDDLQAACEANRRARLRAWPQAEAIIEEELERLQADWHHRQTAPTVRRLRDTAQQIKEAELARLFQKLGDLDPRQRAAIEQGFDRVVNKLLHPPLEALRKAASDGPPHRLLDALRRLFQIHD